MDVIRDIGGLSVEEIEGPGLYHYMTATSVENIGYCVLKILYYDTSSLSGNIESLILCVSRDIII